LAIGTKEVIIMAYGRSNPKRLSDYFGGGGRRKEVPVLSPGSPTRSEIEAGSRQKYKDYVAKDIADSERRRAALEAMWQREKDAETAKRKQAIEEYKVYAEGAPDPKTDIGGVARAAYFNTDLGKKVTDQMSVIIQSSMDKSNRNDPNSPRNQGVSREEFKQAETVGQKFTGYGRKAKDKAGAGIEKAESVTGTTQTINGEKVTFSGETGKDKKGAYYVGVLPNSRKVKVRKGDYKPDKKDAGGDYKGFEWPGNLLRAGAKVTDVEDIQ
jgi:hypothetical protein